MGTFQYFFAQREALETIIYLHDVAGAKDKFDLMRFDSSGAVSAGMFDVNTQEKRSQNPSICLPPVTAARRPRSASVAVWRCDCRVSVCQ